jgi:hypothetical protein
MGDYFACRFRHAEIAMNDSISRDSLRAAVADLLERNFAPWSGKPSKTTLRAELERALKRNYKSEQSLRRWILMILARH